MRTISRRTALLGGAGVLGASFLGGLALLRFDENAAIRTALERLVGDFRMEKGEFATFAADFRAMYQRLEGPRAWLVRGAEWSGLGPVAARLSPSRVGEELERFERALLTNFVVTTDLLQRADPEQRVHYLGQDVACHNPFARFDF